MGSYMLCKNIAVWPPKTISCQELMLQSSIKLIVEPSWKTEGKATRGIYKKFSANEKIALA